MRSRAVLRSVLAATAVAFVGCAGDGGAERRPVHPVATSARPETPADDASARAAEPGSSDEPRILKADINRVPLFREELAAIEKAAFAFVGRRPELGRLVPRSEIDALRALSHEGRTVEGGPVCAAATPLWQLEQARYGSSPSALVTADCYSTPCELRIHVPRRAGTSGPNAGAATKPADAESSAPVRDPLAVGNWLAAVAALVPPPPRAGGGGLLIGFGDSDPRLVRVDHVAPFGAWPTNPTPASFATAQAALDACHEAGQSSGGTEQGAFEVGADGAISRCELYLDEDATRRRDRESCLCAAFSRARFPPATPATAKRRLAVSFMNAPTSTVAQGGLTYGARFDGVVTDPRWEVRSHIQAHALAIAKCHAASNAKGLVRSAVQLQIDALGRVLRASSDLRGPTKACVESALNATKFPCPPSGAPTAVGAQLVMTAQSS